MKISIEKTNFFLKKYYRLILGIIFILLLCLNVFVYYKYVYLATKAEISATVQKASVNEKILNEVLEEIESREETLIRIETNTYADPFSKQRSKTFLENLIFFEFR